MIVKAAVVVVVSASVHVLALPPFALLLTSAFAPFTPAVSASVTRLPAVVTYSVEFSVPLPLTFGLPSSFSVHSHEAHGSAFLIMTCTCDQKHGRAKQLFFAQTRIQSLSRMA